MASGPKASEQDGAEIIPSQETAPQNSSYCDGASSANAFGEDATTFGPPEELTRQNCREIEK
jgi:hypothetical protein